MSHLYSEEQNKNGFVHFREAFITAAFLRISDIQSNPMVCNETLHLVLGNRSSNAPTSLPKKLTNTLKSLDLCLQQVNRYKTKEHGLLIIMLAHVEYLSDFSSACLFLCSSPGFQSTI